MKRFFFVVPAFCVMQARSQDLPLKTQEQMENLASLSEEELPDDDQWQQQLEHLKKHKLNLNEANAEDLQQLQMLTVLQVNSFISYRQILGKLVSIYELQAVPLWDLNTIRKILPFVYAGPAVNLKENFLSRLHGDHNLLLRWSRVLELAKGYKIDSGNRYLGDPNKLLFQYRYQYKDLLYFGMTSEKDAGEQFFKGAQSGGFDFYSFHFFMKKLGIIKSLALGDFAVNFGQGLIQWHSMGFGKGTEATNIKRQSAVLLPYRAAGEINFYRGVGVTLVKRNWEATAFASRKKISGNLNEDTLGTFSSFQTSGYNRTLAEIANRNNVREISLGGNIGFRRRAFEIKLNTVFHQFNRVLKKKYEPYNLFSFTGSKLFNSGIDYSYGYRNIHLFGEFAVDRNINRALVQGIITSVDPKVDVSFLYRNISRAYQSKYANAFTESSSPVNENGIYSGITIRPVYGWTVNTYADFYCFPWVRYRLSAPACGEDYLLHLLYQPNRQTEFSLRFKSEKKPLNATVENGNSYPEKQIRKSVRIHYSTQLNPALTFRWRVEMVWYKHGKISEEGFLGYAEAFKQLTTKLKCNGRFQYVETGGYNSRIYAYESDVPFSFSIPAFYDKGLRLYVNMNYDITRRISASFRAAQTLYKNNEERSGSGMDEIKNNKKTAITAQLLTSL